MMFLSKLFKKEEEKKLKEKETLAKKVALQILHDIDNVKFFYTGVHMIMIKYKNKTFYLSKLNLGYNFYLTDEEDIHRYLDFKYEETKTGDLLWNSLLKGMKVRSSEGLLEELGEDFFT